MIITNKIENQEEIRNLIFDVDGTITRWKNVELFLRKALEKLNIAFRQESLIGLYKAMEMRELHTMTTSESDEDTYGYFLELYIEDLKKYNVSGTKLKDVMFEMEASETFISPEVPEELKLLSKEYEMYCYTNWFRNQTLKKLERYNLKDYFKKIYSSEDTYIKFSKVGFMCLSNKHNLLPEKTVCIGDSKNDILPSHKSGFKTIYLDYGITQETEKSEKQIKLIETADSTVTEFSDIRKVLSKTLYR